MNDAALFALAEHCNCLQVLDVSECEVTATALAAVISGCVSLQELIIGHCSLSEGEVDTLETMAPAALRLVMCSKMRGDGRCETCRWYHEW